MNIQPEEPWEYTGSCERCHSPLEWQGDEPETPDDAVCHDCVHEELHALRARVAELEDATGFARGMASERTAIVAFIRESIDAMLMAAAQNMLRLWANQIERGEHRGETGDGP